MTDEITPENTHQILQLIHDLYGCTLPELRDMYRIRHDIPRHKLDMIMEYLYENRYIIYDETKYPPELYLTSYGLLKYSSLQQYKRLQGDAV